MIRKRKANASRHKTEDVNLVASQNLVCAHKTYRIGGGRADDSFTKTINNESGKLQLNATNKPDYFSNMKEIRTTQFTSADKARANSWVHGSDPSQCADIPELRSCRVHPILFPARCGLCVSHGMASAPCHPHVFDLKGSGSGGSSKGWEAGFRVRFSRTPF